MKLVIPLIALALTGCTTVRYVPVKCLSAEQYGKLEAALPPKVADKLTGKADQDIKTIAASGVRLRGYSEGLLGILKGCVGN